MSLERGFSWGHGEWHFVGYTLAGITTSIFCKTAGVCFDVGQGLPFQNSAKHLCITHAHLDHASGIPYLLAQKTMSGQKESNVYVPPSLLEPLEKILQLWQGLDGHTYEYTLRAAQPGTDYDLDRFYRVRPFRTVHRVESQGYLLYQKKKRLKAEFEGSDVAAILKARASGINPNEEIWEAAVAFSGDTQVEFLDADPDIATAKILFIECTFWDDAKPVKEARRWGHLHFQEFLEILPKLKNEKIVLIHASVRYSTKYLQEILASNLSPEDLKRVEIFPRPL